MRTKQKKCPRGGGGHDICVEDSWLCGGYGKYDTELISCIRSAYIDNGMPLDVTYTGKAFYGMREFLNKYDIQDKKVLFLHTGGTPLFFDLLADKLALGSGVTQLKNAEDDISKLAAFLTEQSAEFAVPLLDRIEPFDYASKILKNGYAFVGKRADGSISGVVCGYANNHQKLEAYESSFVTAPDMRGTGLARLIFERQKEYCKSQGMKMLVFTTNARNKAARAFYDKMEVPVSTEKTTPETIAYEVIL